ncbi:unnamed protein product [Coccothraustes coccothraustes]
MEMDVKGVSPCPEPIPPAAGSGGCPHQRPHHRDGQPAEPAPAADSGHPERRHGTEKEDKKLGHCLDSDVVVCAHAYVLRLESSPIQDCI